MHLSHLLHHRIRCADVVIDCIGVAKTMTNSDCIAADVNTQEGRAYVMKLLINFCANTLQLSKSLIMDLVVTFIHCVHEGQSLCHCANELFVTTYRSSSSRIYELCPPQHTLPYRSQVNSRATPLMMWIAQRTA